MDTTALGEAYRALLDTAAAVTRPGGPNPRTPAGEWSAEQILAHVTLVNAAPIAVVAVVASGANTSYDNRFASDTWTIDHTIEIAGGSVGLRERIRVQGEALCALAGPMLSDVELDTLVPTRLLSNGAVLVDQPMPLRDLITGLADVELPGHAEQLRSLLPEDAAT